MKLRFQLLLLLLGASPALPKPELEPQNVIFITLDGVRYRDIFRAEPIKDAPFLRNKNGYPLAKTTRWASNHNGLTFGTQEDGDEMEVGNSSSLSLPGYKAIFGGRYVNNCSANHGCDYQKEETLVDYLNDTFKNQKEVALFSSWTELKYAIEGTNRGFSAQSLGVPLTNFVSNTREDQRYVEKAAEIQTESDKDLPIWEIEKAQGKDDYVPESRLDQYTWKLATEYIKTYTPRFTYISLLDTDEWAHNRATRPSNRREYFNSLNTFDNQLHALLINLSIFHSKYMRNTSIVISTDHGRGGDAGTFPNHGSGLFGLVPGSENVWTIIIPSKTLAAEYTVERSLHGKTQKYSQLDLRPTIETLLRLPTRSKDIEEGQSLVILAPRK